MRVKSLMIQSLFLMGCLFLSGAKAQLTPEQVDELTVNEQIFNAFL